MQKIIIGFIFILFLTGCIFAPGLSDQDPSSSDIVTRQTTPLDVLANFRYAYKFADSLIYSDVLDSSFIFVSKNYITSPPTDIIWGRDIDIKTTVGMFRHYDILDLTWGDTLEYSEDSLFATTKLTFQLSLVEAGRDLPTLKGEAFFAFIKKPPGIWRITRWDDLSSF